MYKIHTDIVVISYCFVNENLAKKGGMADISFSFHIVGEGLSYKAMTFFTKNKECTALCIVALALSLSCMHLLRFYVSSGCGRLLK